MKPTKDEVLDIDKHVGRRVRIARKLLDYSQGDLGRKVDLTFQQIQKYEKGTNRISASKLHEIAKALDRQIAWFYEDMPADMPILQRSPETDASHFPDLDTIHDPELLAFLEAYWKIEDTKIRQSIGNSVQAVANFYTREGEME